MTGVTADAVVVEVEARNIAKFEREFKRAADTAEREMARIRKSVAKSVSIGVGATSSGNTEREAATVERASTRKINAAKKEAETEEQKSRRISAAVDKGIAARERDAQSAERNAERVRRAGDRAAAARQTANMRAGTALGGRGSMAAPTPAADKINYLLRDQIDTQARFNAARASGNRAESEALRDQLTQFRLINQYKRAGLDETEATARAEDRVADIARRRANRDAEKPDKPDNSGGGDGASSVIDSLKNAAIAAAAGIGVVESARQYVELVDAYRRYNVQLKLATTENGNLAQAQIDNQRIALETRTGIAETAYLYATLQRNAGQLGISQKDSARATETISKSFQISGATAAEASGGITQFLQALQSGTLRGEEFNSIVENAPRLAKLLADQLTNGNIGALRALAGEGKITGKELKEALTNQKFTSQIDKEFKELPVTFDQAMTVLKNAATITFGEFDQGGQFSNSISNFIVDGARGFADLAKSASDTGIDIRATFAGLSDAFAPLLSGAQSAFGGIRSEANYTRESIANILGAIDRVRNAPKELQDFIEGGNADFRKASGFKSASPDRSNLAGEFLGGARQSEAAARRDRSARRLESLGFIVPRNKDGSINEAGIQRPSAQRSANFRPAGSAPVAKASGGASSRSAGVMERQRLAAANRQTRDDEAFNNENEQLRQQQIDALRSQTSDIATLAQYTRDDIASAARKRLAQIDADQATGKYNKEQADENRALARGVALLETVNVNLDERARLEAQNTEKARALLVNQQDELTASLQGVESRKLRYAIEDKITKLRYEQLRKEQDAIINSVDPKTTFADRIAAGERKQVINSQEAGDIRQKALDRETPYQKYRKNLDSADSLSDEIDGIKIQVLDQVADSLAQATTNALGLTGALGDIVGQIIKIGIQRRLIGPLADGLFGKADGSSGGGLGGIIKSIGGLFGGARASGGDVSAGKIYRINENGGEFFQPAMSGKIIPTGRAREAGGGGNTTIVQQTFTIDNRGGITTPQLLDYVNQRARTEAATAGKAAYNASPQRQQKLAQLGS